MSWGEAIVRGSVWLAVLCYPAGPAGRLGRSPRLTRALWTAGWLAFLVHIVASFHVHYDWSHALALKETARQTAEATGFAVGAGLYVNYVFALLWTIDVAWWWRDARSHRQRAASIEIALHSFMLFVLFNGTVVFAEGPARWLGLVATIAGGTALVASLVRRSGPRT